MYRINVENLNLKQIANSGQCFRWKEVKSQQEDCDYHFRVVAFDRCLEMWQKGTEIELNCSKKEWLEIWSDYFDITTDYKSIGEIIKDKGDNHLKEAYKEGSGMRILKQDLWETIVSFMISQNNNIKRISNSVEELCRRGGKCCKIDLGDECDAVEYYSFPKPQELDLSIFEDSSLGLGYRAPYLREIYEFARNNPMWLENLRTLNYEEAMKALMERKGIGVKVANCICLFGLHHVEAFPIDTHVKQLLEKYYKEGFDFETYNGIAGIIQQYLFYYELQE